MKLEDYHLKEAQPIVIEPFKTYPLEGDYSGAFCFVASSGEVAIFHPAWGSFPPDIHRIVYTDDIPQFAPNDHVRRFASAVRDSIAGALGSYDWSPNTYFPEYLHEQGPYEQGSSAYHDRYESLKPRTDHPDWQRLIFDVTGIHLPGSKVPFTDQLYFRAVYERSFGNDRDYLELVLKRFPPDVQASVVRLFKLFFHNSIALERFLFWVLNDNDGQFIAFVPEFERYVTAHFEWFHELTDRLKKHCSELFQPWHGYPYHREDLGSYANVDYPPKLSEMFDPQRLFDGMLKSAAAPLSNSNQASLPDLKLSFLRILLQSVNGYEGRDRLHPLTLRVIERLAGDVRIDVFRGGDDAALQFTDNDHRMFTDSVDAAIAPFDPDHARHVEAKLPSQLNDPDCVFVRICVEGHTAGLCRVQHFSDDTYELGTLYVAPEFRGIVNGAFLQQIATSWTPWNAKCWAVTSTRTSAMFRHIEGYAVATGFDFTEDEVGRSGELFHLEAYDPACYLSKDPERFSHLRLVEIANGETRLTTEESSRIQVCLFDARAENNQAFIQSAEARFRDGYHVTRCFPVRSNDMSTVCVAYEKPSAAPRSDRAY